MHFRRCWQEKDWKDAALFLYFATPQSVKSQHCQDEVNLALDTGKHTVAVHLQKTELTSGLQLRLSSHQAILKYEMSDQDYRDKLLAGIGGHVSKGLTATTPTSPGPATGTNRAVLIGFGLLAIAVVVAAVILRPGELASESPRTTVEVDQFDTPAAIPAEATERPSVAKLPFENLSALEENAFFAAGIDDHTLSTLARIKGIKVISRTSVLPYANSGKSMVVIGEELNVGHILEGVCSAPLHRSASRCS